MKLIGKTFRGDIWEYQFRTTHSKYGEFVSIQAITEKMHDDIGRRKAKNSCARGHGDIIN